MFREPRNPIRDGLDRYRERSGRDLARALAPRGAPGHGKNVMMVPGCPTPSP